MRDPDSSNCITFVIRHCFLGVQRLKVHELPVDCCSDDSRGRYVSSFYQIYDDIGLLDSIPGLIVADSTLSVPFAVILMTGFMSGMPRSLVEAAQIDGASQWGVFTKIVIPLSRNTIVTTSLFAFLWAWSDFMFASTLDSGGGKMRPITMGLYDFIGSQNQEWGPMMATAVLASVPTALLLIFAQKYVAAGVTAGAVKD